MDKTCSFTGHRLHKIPWLDTPNHPLSVILHDLIKDAILRKIDEGCTHFISGMAQGADMFCAKIVLELRHDHPEITLECALPCLEQSHPWSPAQRDDYQEILDNCNSINIISRHCSRACWHLRNQYLVTQADCLIAIWNGSSGGTKNTIDLARKKGIPIDIINPDDCANLYAS